MFEKQERLMKISHQYLRKGKLKKYLKYTTISFFIPLQSKIFLVIAIIGAVVLTYLETK